MIKRTNKKKLNISEFENKVIDRIFDIKKFRFVDIAIFFNCNNYFDEFYNDKRKIIDKVILNLIDKKIIEHDENFNYTLIE